MTKPDTEDAELRQRALKQLKKRREFSTHLLFYVLINALVVVIWFATGADGFFWPGLLMGFWGVAVVMNAWDVWRGDSFTEEQISDEMSRLRSNK